jgi:tetratricopeptide (TPR) repeat protein
MNTTKPNLLNSNNRNDLDSLKRDEEASSHIMAARNALRKGQRAEAKEFIKQAFAVKPGDATAVELLGDMFLEEGETERALALYERALQVHPKHPVFEEKAAICRLDLAEMESDKLSRTTLIELGDTGKIFERVPHKAVSLSMLVPGAGQFYNEENEKGAVFLGIGLLCALGWFYPLWTQLSSQSIPDRLNFGMAISALGGGWSFMFWSCLTLWIAVYAVSMIDAGREAARFNRERRRAVGLEN